MPADFSGRNDLSFWDERNKMAAFLDLAPGIVTMLSVTQPYTNHYTGGALKFAGHVANYPVCWVYNHNPGYEFSSLTEAPVLIHVGELDAYDLPDSCSNLVQSLTPAQQEHIS